MAEGTSADLRIAEDILACPICLENFTNPKTLPCIHTFCKSCLSTYINQSTGKTSTKARTTGFPCPVCRAVTSPKDVSAEISTWVDQFPSNYFIADVINMVTLQKKEKFCDICQKRGRTGVKGDVWCGTCKKCLCKACKETHDMFQEHDNIVELAALTMSSSKAIDTSVKCSKHGDKVDFFCCDHQEIGCSKCVAVDHRKCDKVVTAEEYTKTLKGSKDVEVLISDYDEQLHDIEKIIHFNKTTAEGLKRGRDNAAKEISDMREKINKHLDKLEAKSLEKLNRLYKEKSAKTEDELQQCKIYQSTIEQNKRLLQTTAMFGGESQYLAVYLKSRATSSEIRKCIDSEVAGLIDVDLHFDINPNMDQLFTASEFGDIHIVQRGRGGSLIGKGISSFERTATLSHSLNVQCDSDRTCRITGGLFLQDGRFVLCDRNNQALKLVDISGQVVYRLHMSTQPWDICALGDSNYVVSLPSANKIAFIEITGNQLSTTTEMEVGCQCHGIAGLNDDLVISSGDSYQNTIRIIKQNGKLLHKREVNNGSPYHVRVNQKQSSIVASICSGGSKSMAVIYDSNLNELSRLNYIDMNCILGLELDQEGNIFLCGRDSGIVKQVSSDLKKTRNVVSLKRVLAIIFGGDKIILSTEDSSTINIYNFQ